MIQQWRGGRVLRDNLRVLGQIGLFSRAQIAGMRDRTRRRNYSEEAEEFRREHAIRRQYGLAQRHAQKLTRLYGSPAKAAAAIRREVEELTARAATPPSCDPAGPARPASAPTPVKAEPVKAEPVKAEPVKAEPVKTEPVKAEPVKTKPVKTKPVKTKPVKTKPVKAGPADAKPVDAKPAKAEPAKAEPAKTGPAKTEPAKAKSGETAPADAASAETEPVDHKGVGEAAEVSTPSRSRRFRSDNISRCAPRRARSARPERRRPGWLRRKPAPAGKEMRRTGHEMRRSKSDRRGRPATRLAGMENQVRRHSGTPGVEDTRRSRTSRISVGPRQTASSWPGGGRKHIPP
jgi:hypothetical protein